jgi:hypothetical protein
MYFENIEFCNCPPSVARLAKLDNLHIAKTSFQFLFFLFIAFLPHVIHHSTNPPTNDKWLLDSINENQVLQVKKKPCVLAGKKQLD